MPALRQALRWALFPGMNLHARLRFRDLPAYFSAGAGRRVLDAGCGNGMLGYQAALTGAKVIGISFKEKEVANCRALFNGLLRIPEERLRFTLGNLYDLRFEDETFDEIICSEVLEHLRRDRDVCTRFHALLRESGVLHLCAPNAAHPYNADFPLDETESGGHVRPGYTAESYRSLLEPLGFEIVAVRGIGGPIRQAFNRRIKEVQERFGAAAGLPLFLLALPALWFESDAREPEVPFSIYVKAVKRRRGSTHV